jgi:hypothetical protein
VTQASIFDLPERRWDAATMFFCAESITRDGEEFALACRSFARAVRPGGTVAAAFLSRSEGYAVDGMYFPAVNIDEVALTKVFGEHLAAISVVPVGITEQEIRTGYTGALFLLGLAKA